MIVYKITNTKTGMAYIGATKSTLPERMGRHWYSAFREIKTYPIYEAMREYGRKSFSVEIIKSGIDSYDELMRLEVEAIAKHGTFVPNGYNLTSGGLGTSDRRCLESSRELMGAKARRPCPDHVKERLSKLFTGRTFSSETRAKLRASAHRGKNNPSARAISLYGIPYDSIIEAMKATKLTRMQIRTRLKKGEAVYLEDKTP